MKRRNTVSVTPAMGASTVAGRISTPPKSSNASTGVLARGKASVAADSPAADPPELSQYFRTGCYRPSPILMPANAALTNKNPRFARGFVNSLTSARRRQNLLLDRFSRFAVLAAETLHAARRIHQFLLAREKRMARRTNFHRNIGSLRRPRHKLVPAGAMHAPLTVHRMNRCLHNAPQPFLRIPLF